MGENKISNDERLMDKLWWFHSIKLDTYQGMDKSYPNMLNEQKLCKKKSRVRLFLF